MDNGTWSNQKTPNLTMKDLQMAVDKLNIIPPVPHYDTIVGHPEKLDKEMQEICGMTVHTSEAITDRIQVKFPKSKKKRIRKKWAKRARNFGDKPSDTVYLISAQKILNDMWKRNFNMMDRLTVLPQLLPCAETYAADKGL